MDLNKKISKPKFVNPENYHTENFPRVVGFCDIDIKSHKVGKGFESYDYKLGEERIYKLIKRSNHWDINEYINGKGEKRSFGKNLKWTLFYALALPDNRDNKRGNMIFPVNPDKKENALVYMYYFGGYPGFWLSDGLKSEFRGKFQIPGEIPVFAYSKIPWAYMFWIIDTLEKLGVLERELVYFWNDPRMKDLEKK